MIGLFPTNNTTLEPAEGLKAPFAFALVCLSGSLHLSLFPMGFVPNQQQQQPMFCLNWPWESQPPRASHCDLGSPPWLFKSLQNLGALTFDFFNSLTNSIAQSPLQKLLTAKPFFQLEFNFVGQRIDQEKFSNWFGFNNNNNRNKNKSKGLSAEVQAEAEQRALALALASGKDGTVIEFYSPRCKLCNSLLGFMLEVEKRNFDWLSIVMADAENEKWLPELLHYDIQYVPCFVILDKHGRALSKTGVPSSRFHVVAGVSIF